jgi:hypothetical protein
VAGAGYEQRRHSRNDAVTDKPPAGPTTNDPAFRFLLHFTPPSAAGGPVRSRLRAGMIKMESKKQLFSS